jgi:ribosomal protein S18 acetylase RimI-like enzyme
MTAAPPAARLLDADAGALRSRLPEALRVYVAAMGYPPSTATQRTQLWLSHMTRPGWRSAVALGENDELLGVAYGYLGAADQWWYDQVRDGLQRSRADQQQLGWLRDYFELTELHVRPDAQGGGIGEGLLRRLVHRLQPATGADKVLLSTPEGPTRAWRLYLRLGFVSVLRRHQFSGDTRPFAVLGRRLPLPPAAPPPS